MFVDVGDRAGNLYAVIFVTKLFSLMFLNHTGTIDALSEI